MKDNVIYHNPKCSKSRKALEILTERGAAFEVIEYLKAPPTAAELDELCSRLGVEPLEITRSGDDRFKELGLSTGDARTREEWIQLLVEHPALLQRPIVVLNGRAVVGRPPENVLELLPPRR